MSVLRQPCPTCKCELELPAGTGGRMAQCPACEATFRIAGPSESADSDPTVGKSVDSNSPESGDDTNPYRDPLASGSASLDANPYQPSDHLEHETPPEVEPGSIHVVTRPIDDVIGLTASIFAARWVPLIVTTIIVIAVSAVVIVLPVVMIAILADAGNQVSVIVGLAVLIPIAFAYSSAVVVGTTRVGLAVARNQPSPMTQILPPTRIVIRFMIGMLAALSAVTVVSVLYFVLALAFANATDPDVAGPILALIGFVMYAVASMFAMCLLWPWVFVVVDEKGTAIGSIVTAYQISKHNKLTSLFLVILSSVLSTVGSACYIGHLITMPVTMTMLVVAYLLMTNQPISDPKRSDPERTEGRFPSGTNPDSRSLSKPESPSPDDS